MIRSAAESGENAEYLGLLADRVAQTHVLPIDAATIRECCGERASQPVAPPRVRRTGCGLLGPDITAGQLGRLSIIEGLAGLASGAAVQAVRERRAGTMTASTSTGPRVSKADRLLALAKQHHERRDAARWPYLLRDGRMAACCLSAGRLGNNVKSEIQGLHTEALQCAGYYGSHALALRDHFAAPPARGPAERLPGRQGRAGARRGVPRVGAYGSVSTGYDPGYLLRESSKGMEGYYLSAVAECGEPPGVWTGRACPGLGLERGSEVEPDVMEVLYGQLLDPRDPLFADKDVLPEDKTHLGAPPRNYKAFQERFDAMVAAEPDATPERLEQLVIQARKDQRQAVMFFDFTYSADKTTSILHASLQAAAVRAEEDGDAHAAAGYRRMAGAVEDAVRAGAAAALEYLQDEAGYSRAGYHGAVPKDERGRPLARHATGRWVDAHRWVVAQFLQHTSRDGDPQLHVHNAILNRVGVRRRDVADDRLPRALHRARAAAWAVGGRVQDELISRELGAAYEQRPDGHGRELTGVPQQVKDMFSSRRAAITAGVAELAADYEARHGRAPNARALFSMAQYVTLAGRRAKPKRAHAPAREEMLDGWAGQMGAAELGALDAIPSRGIGTQDPAAPGIDELAGAELDRVLWAAASATSRPGTPCGPAPSCSRRSTRSCPAGSAAWTPPASATCWMTSPAGPWPGTAWSAWKPPSLVPVPAALTPRRRAQRLLPARPGPVHHPAAPGRRGTADGRRRGDRQPRRRPARRGRRARRRPGRAGGAARPRAARPLPAEP